MHTKLFNLLVILATAVSLLPLAASGGVTNAQQIAPVERAAIGEAQSLPLCTSLVAAAALTPSIATNAAGTTHTVSLSGAPVPVTATWSVEGFPVAPTLVAATPTAATIRMDTPGTASITAVVDAGSGPVCYMRAEKHFAEVTTGTLNPSSAQREMVWNEEIKRFVAPPVTITGTALGEYLVKLGDPANAPEPEGAPAPGGGFYHWNGTVLRVINAPVANATATFVVTAPCVPAGPGGIVVSPDGRSGTLLPTDSAGRASIAVRSDAKGTCGVTLTAGTSSPDLARISGTAFVTFYDLQASTPQLRWAGEALILEKWLGTELAGLAVRFHQEQGSPGCLAGLADQCDTIYAVIDPFGYARGMYDSEVQGQVDVTAEVLDFRPLSGQTVQVNGFTLVKPEEVPTGPGILSTYAFLIWYLKLEDVTLGSAVLPSTAAIGTALGLTLGQLPPNQAAALIGILIGAPSTLGMATNQNAGLFSGAPGTSTTDGKSAYEPRESLPNQIFAITGKRPREDQVNAFDELFNKTFNVVQPSSLVGGLIPGTVTADSSFVTNRQLLQAQVRGWFVGKTMCVNEERRVRDGTRDEMLPLGRCILPDDWPMLAGRLDWRQSYPTYDLMDNPGDQVKSGPIDGGSAKPGSGTFPFNARGAYYRYVWVPSSPLVAQPAESLAAAFPVIGPNSALDPAYVTAGVVFDPRISLAPRDNYAGSVLPPGCDDVNDAAASGDCTPASGSVGSRGKGPLLAPGPGGAGTGPALAYVDATGSYSWARKTHVPNETLDWYDAAMPPARIVFESLGPTIGELVAADKANILRARDFIGLSDTAARLYAWRTTAPFYQMEIPASSSILATTNAGGYDWDSWGSDGAAPAGPYDFWAIANRPSANKAVVYSDNNGRAMILLSSGDVFDLTRFRNQNGGFDIPAGAIVGTSEIRATAEYPYFRKHPPAVSSVVTKSWVSQFDKRLVGVPVGQRIRVTAVAADLHGACRVGEEIRFFIEGPPGFTGEIADTSDGPAGLLTQTTAVAFARNDIPSSLAFPDDPLYRGGTLCGAFVVIQNLSAGARVKAFFASELIERFYPPLTHCIRHALWPVTFSVNVRAGDLDLGGFNGSAVLDSCSGLQTVNIPWASTVDGQAFAGILTVLVGGGGDGPSIQIMNVSGKLGNIEASVPISNGTIWILGPRWVQDFSFTGTANVAGVGNITVTVSGNVTAGY